MSIHNIHVHCMFSWRNKKNINTFGLKKASYQELCIQMNGLKDRKQDAYIIPSVKKITNIC